MLIRFRVQNYLSFKDEVEISMIPGKVQKHSTHLTTKPSGLHQTKLLRGAAIFGANASGKSNLIKAFEFSRSLIVSGTKPKQRINVSHFKLDNELILKPSKFEFEIRILGDDYIYGFSVTSQAIKEEWLHLITATTTKPLFDRVTNGDLVNVTFGRSVNKLKSEKDFLDFVARGTRPNQLFLTECADRNVKQFTKIIKWFSHTLQIITSDYFYPINSVNSFEIQKIQDFYSKFDTGICGIELKNIPWEGNFEKDFFSTITSDLLKDEYKGKTIGVLGPNLSRYFFSLDKEKNVICQKMLFKHKMTDCEKTVAFDFSEESDGTIRLLDLIPILYLGEKKENDVVFVIDEIDRSLHPELSRKLLEIFLGKEGENSQILLTTHDSSLMNLELLRRDEYWFMEKMKDGSSQLHSLEEFRPRYDNDIQKGYLLGRFGGVPILKQTSLKD